MWDILRYWMLAGLLFAASVTDIKKMELPNGLTLGVAGAALLRFCDSPEGTVPVLEDMLLGAAVVLPVLAVVVILDRLLSAETMGGGDIKLIAALGLHFGPLRTVFLIVAACLIGLVSAAFKGNKKGTAFPFGPMLAGGALITVLFGNALENAFLELFF